MRYRPRAASPPSFPREPPKLSPFRRAASSQVSQVRRWRIGHVGVRFDRVTIRQGVKNAGTDARAIKGQKSCRSINCGRAPENSWQSAPLPPFPETPKRPLFSRRATAKILQPSSFLPISPVTHASYHIEAALYGQICIYIWI